MSECAARVPQTGASNPVTSDAPELEKRVASRRGYIKDNTDIAGADKSKGWVRLRTPPDAKWKEKADTPVINDAHKSMRDDKRGGVTPLVAVSVTAKVPVAVGVPERTAPLSVSHDGSVVAAITGAGCPDTPTV